MTQPSNEQLHRESVATEADAPAPEEALPRPDRTEHSKQPEGDHDAEYDLAVERTEVEMGSRDYVPEDVPDAEPIE
jgi:hypothetical protein